MSSDAGKRNERMQEGQCWGGWNMALALHRSTGFPMCGLFDEAGLCHHAFVLAPDDSGGAEMGGGVSVSVSGVDARGQQAVQDLMRGCPGQVVRRIDEQDLARWAGRELSSEEVSEAHRVIRATPELTQAVQVAEIAKKRQSANLDRVWRDLSCSNTLADWFDMESAPPEFSAATLTSTRSGVRITPKDFVLQKRLEDGAWIDLTVREVPDTDPDPHAYYSSALESLDFPKGTGAATRMYLAAIHVAQKRGIGWSSESIRSDESRAIYERLRKAGVPFVNDGQGGPDALSAEALSQVDLPAVAVNLQTLAALGLATDFAHGAHGSAQQDKDETVDLDLDLDLTDSTGALEQAMDSLHAGRRQAPRQPGVR